MSEVAIYVCVAAGFSILLLALLRPRDNSAKVDGASINGSFEGVAPSHYRFLPQIRQALSAEDLKYLREAAPPHVVKRVLRERREIARAFLSGLHEDFSKLERMARMVAALSPVVSREQETKRLFLSLTFHLLYAMVWVRIAIGPVPMQQLDQLAVLIGRFAVRMEHAIGQINAVSNQPIPDELNA